jgi:hypothetical protein
MNHPHTPAQTTRVPSHRDSRNTLLPVFGSASKKKTIYFEILKKISCEPRRNFLVPPLIKNRKDILQKYFNFF